MICRTWGRGLIFRPQTIRYHYKEKSHATSIRFFAIGSAWLPSPASAGSKRQQSDHHHRCRRAVGVMLLLRVSGRRRLSVPTRRRDHAPDQQYIPGPVGHAAAGVTQGADNVKRAFESMDAAALARPGERGTTFAIRRTNVGHVGAPERVSKPGHRLFGTSDCARHLHGV